jgi:excisionase family DNA binding protein
MPVAARQPLATSEEVAEYLGVSKRTLDDWAHRGTGPAYSRVGRHRRYAWPDVDAYVEQERRGGPEAA